ncbi:hypothetical protein GALMADRAFT_134699 [Galerina marginata CBS 339.88]|uniref:F-box domain-containing protein n=1 Tax=Galerina marginata (strain CBS 339.88) TaxID=685588 RepID=A0A067TLJ1_GALM3|nr:hypothetical protein GALMADRAFT_134699 [Galerina marginata CBS 339.88]
MINASIFRVELFERILLNVHDNRDVEGLRNCSYASQTLRPLSQKLLFREIRLTLDETQRPSTSAEEPMVARLCLWQAFSDLLDRSPHLCGFVHTLQITRDVLTWMTEKGEDDNLEKILNRLPNLQKLFIVLGKENASDNDFWGLIAPRIQNALLECLYSPKIVDIDLSGLPFFPAAHFDGFPATLKRLTMTVLKFELDMLDLLKSNDHADPKTTIARYRFALKNLVIRDVAQPGPTLNWLSSDICPLNMLQVQDLTFAPLDPRGQTMTETLKDHECLLKRFLSITKLRYRLCSPNMEANHWSRSGWNIYYDPYTLPPTDIARIFPSLRSLELESSWRYLPEQEAYMHPTSWINNLLKMSANMGLESIVLHMSIHIDGEALEEVDWDKLLSGLDHRLKSIIELRISGLDLAGEKILLQNEVLKSLPKRIVFL